MTDEESNYTKLQRMIGPHSRRNTPALVVTFTPMPELSPAAQAVLEASAERWAGTRTQAIAAAIREIAAKYSYEVHGDGWYELVVDASDLYKLADELEAHEA